MSSKKPDKVSIEEHLKILIDGNKKEITIHEEKLKKLREKSRFLSDHKFDEENRIVQIKINAIDCIVYDYAQMIKDCERILKK